MKTFKEHLSESLLFEDASATEMEKKIVSAYNNVKGSDSIPDKIAEKIKNELSSSARAGILIHGGTRTAKRNPDWIGIFNLYFEVTCTVPYDCPHNLLISTVVVCLVEFGSTPLCKITNTNSVCSGIAKKGLVAKLEFHCRYFPPNHPSFS